MTPRGFTLIELLVVLAVLGVLTAITVTALPPLDAPPADTARALLERGRYDAIWRGRPIPVVIGLDTVVFRPDGSASGGPIVREGQVLAVHPFSGAVRDDR